MAHPFLVGQVKFDPSQPPIALQPFTFSPYNTQNTITHYEAFWGLYLPITTTFRVCDIWRGFWVQRLLWDIGGRLVFATSTVDQVRNSHSYIKDMQEEHDLYQKSGSFARFLTLWSSSLPSLPERIVQLARAIAQAHFWDHEEIEIMKAWISDLHSLGYKFPSIVRPALSRTVIRKKRAAVCVTGLTECIDEAWAKSDVTLRERLHGDIDTFLFLSSSYSSKGSVPLNKRLKQVRSYLNSTVTVLYEDRIIDPQIPSDCKAEFQLRGGAPIPVLGYLQQLWALAECYHLVKDYEKRFHVQYQLLVRTRIDILNQMPSTFDRADPFNINTTIILPRNRYFPQVYDDGFAMGPMESMFYYMTRWYHLKRCPPDGVYQPGIYLFRHLQRFLNVTIDPESTGAADAIAHGSKFCH